MLNVKLNPIIQAISGKLGDIVFRVSKTGKVTITKRADVSGVVPSEARLAQRERFKQAIEYAGAAMAEQEVRTVYETMAAKEHQGPYAMAFCDYLNGNDLLAKN
jgi:hypothetical protein